MDTETRDADNEEEKDNRTLDMTMTKPSLQRPCTVRWMPFASPIAPCARSSNGQHVLVSFVSETRFSHSISRQLRRSRPLWISEFPLDRCRCGRKKPTIPGIRSDIGKRRHRSRLAAAVFCRLRRRCAPKDPNRFADGLYFPRSFGSIKISISLPIPISSAAYGRGIHETAS